MRKEIWTETANIEYEQNIDYVLRRWSVKEALKFIDKVEAILYDLKKEIVEYPLTAKINVRKCVVVKQITLFYEIDTDNNLVLLSFWDNYQDTEQLEF
jgi:plasmid stabilization system protein ParE